MANQPKKYKKFVATAATATLVASAIVPVASAATPSFPDIAGNDHAKAIEAIYALGYISGKADGTFAPNEEVKRSQVVYMLGRWAEDAGLKVPADYKTVQRFKDVPLTADETFLKYTALLKDNGIFNGSNGNLNGGDKFQRQHMAVVLNSAVEKITGTSLVDLAGDTSDVTIGDLDKVIADYRDEVLALKKLGITSPANFNPSGIVTRGQFATFLNATINVEGTEVAVKSVSATNAKTLKVEFNTAVDTTKATIEAKRGSVKPSVKEIKFSEDKKSATIEFTTAMAAGDYTVSVSGLTEQALTGTVKVEAEKLTKINFLSDIAVISGDNVVTTVTAENQYGELITKKLNTSNTNITGTTSKGSSVSINNDGRLTVAGSTGLFKADDKVVVTVVDSATGVTATKTLTVAQAASVQSITTGEFKTDDKELAAKPLNVANYDSSKFYLPVEIKDQYGNVLKAADLNGSVTVTSSNKEILNPAATVFVDTDNGVVAKFQAAPTAQTHGTAVLTFVAAATGKTASASVTIKENYKLDVVTLETPSTELKVSKAAELPLSITNSYGEQVSLKDVTVGGTSTALTLDTNTTINAIGATLSVEQDYVNKKAVLKITPTAKNITLTLVTATGKSQVLSLTANDTPVVSGIKGVDADFVSLLANDTTLSTQLDGNVEFVDQYGDLIDAPAYDATDANNALDYTIAPKVTSAVTTNSGGTITASTTAGSETYVVTLKNAAGTVLDTQEVTVTVVDAAKLTEFGISDVNKFYTLTGATAYAQDLDIFGLIDGKKVLVNQSMAKDFTATNGLLGVNATTGVYTPTTVDTDGKDIASTVQVLVEAGTSTYVVTKEVTYSDALPKAASLAVELDEKAAPAVVQVTPVTTENIITGSDKLAIFAKDQYGEVITTGYKFVITNNDTGQAISIATDGTITLGGALPSGKTFTINATIDGITKSVKVIVE